MTHHFDAALQAELDYRRTTLAHAAERHQLARLAGRAARAATRRLSRTARPATRTVAAPAGTPAHV